MKLNDKSLSNYAGSGAPPDKEGYLSKRGDFNKGYQKRWFVLKGNLLFYYDKRLEKDPIGVIVLEGCTVELSDQEDGFTFMIHFPGTNSRTYIMSADTQEDMECWMKVLSCAGYDYMKVCVNELKNQLQDLDSNTNKKLLQSALEDGKNFRHSVDSHQSLIQSGSSEISDTSSNHSVKSGPRHNPFFTGDLFDFEECVDRGSVVEKRARTFLEMHEEYRQQIEEVMTEWLKHHTLVAKQPVVTS